MGDGSWVGGRARPVARQTQADEMTLLMRHGDVWRGPLRVRGRGRFERGLIHVTLRESPFFSQDVTDWLGGENGAWAGSLYLSGLHSDQMGRLASRPFL